MHVVTSKYISDEFSKNNVLWDEQDSVWKAQKISKMLIRNNISPLNLCDIGCGTGAVLSDLRSTFPNAKMHGYDIAPKLQKIWIQRGNEPINFKLSEFDGGTDKEFDTILVLDLLEHLPDPHAFLSKIKNCANHFIFHFPLDLSSISVLREKPLINMRRNVGHIHYFTKNLAIELLDEAGFKVLEAEYSYAYWSSPHSTWKTKIAAIPRYILSLVNPDLSAKFLGGQTLFVLAKRK